MRLARGLFDFTLLAAGYAMCFVGAHYVASALLS